MMAPETNVELMERVSLELKRDLDLDGDDEDTISEEEGSSRGNRDESFVLPPSFSGKHQMRAMLQRQWLFKVSNPPLVSKYL